jgi:hypothetical protein
MGRRDAERQHRAAAGASHGAPTPSGARAAHRRRGRSAHLAQLRPSIAPGDLTSSTSAPLAQIVRLQADTEGVQPRLSVLDLFSHPTIPLLATFLNGGPGPQNALMASSRHQPPREPAAGVLQSHSAGS